MNLERINKNISNRIPPNYSSWETIERTHLVCAEAIIEGIPGDFVECGVAAGNNFGAMLSAGRYGWGFDSFEGIPWAGEFDEQQPGIGEIPKIKEGRSSGVSAHTLENVVLDLTKWGFKPEQYQLVKGWFEDTLPGCSVKQIAVLRLDGDLYESTYTSLENLLPKLSIGGFLIIDDWNLAGCRQAFSDYVRKTRAAFELEVVFSENNNGPRYFKRIK